MKVVAAFFVCSSLRSFQRRRRQMFFLSDFGTTSKVKPSMFPLVKKMLKPGGEIITMTSTKNRATDANETLSAKHPA